MRVLGLGLIMLLCASGAMAEDWRAVANAFDRDRLERHDAAFGKAMQIAMTEGTRADLQTVLDLFATPPQPIDPAALTGDWRCRTIKLGGPFAGLVVYGWFRCRILSPEGRLRFVKLSGSQRTLGRLFADSSNRMIYLGTAHYPEELPLPYSGPGLSKGRVRENRDDPAILTQRGPGRLMLGFPWPILESDYDILELRRR